MREPGLAQEVARKRLRPNFHALNFSFLCTRISSSASCKATCVPQHSRNGVQAGQDRPASPLLWRLARQAPTQ